MKHSLLKVNHIQSYKPTPQKTQNRAEIRIHKDLQYIYRNSTTRVKAFCYTVGKRIQTWARKTLGYCEEVRSLHVHMHSHTYKAGGKALW